MRYDRKAPPARQALAHVDRAAQHHEQTKSGIADLGEVLARGVGARLPEAPQAVNLAGR